MNRPIRPPGSTVTAEVTPDPHISEVWIVREAGYEPDSRFTRVFVDPLDAENYADEMMANRRSSYVQRVGVSRQGHVPTINPLWTAEMAADDAAPEIVDEHWTRGEVAPSDARMPWVTWESEHSHNPVVRVRHFDRDKALRVAEEAIRNGRWR